MIFEWNLLFLLAKNKGSVTTLWQRSKEVLLTVILDDKTCSSSKNYQKKVLR